MVRFSYLIILFFLNTNCTNRKDLVVKEEIILPRSLETNKDNEIHLIYAVENCNILDSIHFNKLYNLAKNKKKLNSNIFSVSFYNYSSNNIEEGISNNTDFLKNRIEWIGKLKIVEFQWLKNQYLGANIYRDGKIIQYFKK